MSNVLSAATNRIRALPARQPVTRAARKGYSDGVCPERLPGMPRPESTIFIRWGHTVLEGEGQLGNDGVLYFFAFSDTKTPSDLITNPIGVRRGLPAAQPQICAVHPPTLH